MVIYNNPYNQDSKEKLIDHIDSVIDKAKYKILRAFRH